MKATKTYHLKRSGKRKTAIYRAYKVELKPNNKQKTLFLKGCGVARFVYNWGLEQRIREYKDNKKTLSAFDQSKILNKIKQEKYPWMLEVSKWILAESFANLDKAYKNFFRRVNAKGKSEFPKFKSRRDGIGSFRLRAITDIEEGRIKLPRIGWVRLKEKGYIPVDGIYVLSATISEKAGHWFVSVNCREDIKINQAKGEPIGIDLGIKELAVVSNGRRFKNPKALRKVQKKLKRIQRELFRRKKGSENREKTIKKLTKVHCRISNIRKDAINKVTSELCARTKPAKKRPRIIVLEDLNVAGMVKNHHLAQAISDVGMGMFRWQMEYKAKWAGEEIMLADRFYPSSKTCHHCGRINKGLTLADRKWLCECGIVLDRDLNAAINLRNLSIPAKSREFKPVENGVVMPSTKQEASSQGIEVSLVS